MTSPGICACSRCWRSWTCFATASGTMQPFHSLQLPQALALTPLHGPCSGRGRPFPIPAFVLSCSRLRCQHGQSRGSLEPHLFWAMTFSTILLLSLGWCKPQNLRASVPSAFYFSCVASVASQGSGCTSLAASARGSACAAPGASCSCLVLLHALPLVSQDPGETIQATKTFIES